MEKFSYAKDFIELAKVNYTCDGDGKTKNFTVVIGNHDDEESTFLALGEVITHDFENCKDASRATELAAMVLSLVDKNLELGLKLSDVRKEVLNAIAKTDLRHEDYLTAARAADKIFDYYISHGA